MVPYKVFFVKFKTISNIFTIKNIVQVLFVIVVSKLYFNLKKRHFICSCSIVYNIYFLLNDGRTLHKIELLMWDYSLNPN